MHGPKEERTCERLHAQTHMGHGDWKATGTKTTVPVDGFDHINREQSPEHWLINELCESMTATPVFLTKNLRLIFLTRKR